jgi:N-methylhydantoinase A/oxoprolinase/acetone carboxylase beta subunit
LRLRQPIIGIGAPASIFLKDVAEVLHTDLILPDHHEVANAVGAVGGSVMVTEEILIYPRMSEDGFNVLGYYVQVSDGRKLYQDIKEARSYAHTAVQKYALKAAQHAGADNPQVTVKEEKDGLDAYRIQARAMGNPRLMK